MAKPPLVGTITRAFDGALDGMAASLVRRRKGGYTVALLASRPPFQQGDLVHLSMAEFLLPTERPRAPSRRPDPLSPAPRS